jgi:hypothetical protein
MLHLQYRRDLTIDINRAIVYKSILITYIVIHHIHIPKKSQLNIKILIQHYHNI